MYMYAGCSGVVFRPFCRVQAVPAAVLHLVSAVGGNLILSSPGIAILNRVEGDCWATGARVYFGKDECLDTTFCFAGAGREKVQILYGKFCPHRLL